MTYHKGMHLKATGPLMGAGIIGMGKNKQFNYLYPYPRFTHTCTHVGYSNLCSCLGCDATMIIVVIAQSALRHYMSSEYYQ